MSRIGKRPVDLPSGVSASVSGQTIEVKGPKGTHSFTATDDVTLAVEDNAVTVTPRGKSKRARQQWGMSRTMVANMVTGVSDGFKKELEIQGVGYWRRFRFHPEAELALHDELRHSAGHLGHHVKPTEIIIKQRHPAGRPGCANIRDWRRPEPYRKRIRYKGEYIFSKEGEEVRTRQWHSANGNCSRRPPALFGTSFAR